MDRAFREGLPGDSPELSKEIVVIGGGGHARVVISILRKLTRYAIKGYTDFHFGQTLLGAPFLGSDDEVAKLLSESPGLNAVLGVGQVGLGTARQQIWRRLKSVGLVFPEIISPNAMLNEEVTLGEGVVVMDGVAVNTGARLGVGAIVNTNSTIEHDVQLGDWVHIAPGTTISGGVTIGPYSMIGAGATIIEGREIAPETIIGAGSTVVRDIHEPGIYVGTPARRIK